MVIVEVFIHLELLFLIDIGGSLGRLFFIVWEATEQSSNMALPKYLTELGIVKVVKGQLSKAKSPMDSIFWGNSNDDKELHL